MTTTKLRVAGSFSGTGGLELGFQRAGFEIVWSNEIDTHAHKTYAANFNAKHLDTRSIWDVDPAEIPDHDVFVGGFPCQPFSQAGVKLGFADKRGTLFEAIANILSVKRPSGFLLENVKGLVGHDGGRTLRIIKETMEEVGYTVNLKVLNAAEYGNTPQGRERIYLVGFLGSESPFAWPEEVPLTRTVQDMLEPDAPAKYYYDHRYGHISEKINEAVTDAAVYQWRKTYVRRNQSGLFPTLTANAGGGGHNVPIVRDPDTGKARKITPREAFNMMGYPQDFILPEVADCHLYKQAGNAVVIPVVRAIAERMAVRLREMIPARHFYRDVNGMEYADVFCYHQTVREAA
jgi:DNA (cytosine-5)-methyltransferase 1